MSPMAYAPQRILPNRDAYSSNRTSPTMTQPAWHLRPLLVHQLSAILMAFRWWANNGLPLWFTEEWGVSSRKLVSQG